MDTHVDGSITNQRGPQFIGSSLTGTFNFNDRKEPEPRPQPSSTVPFSRDPDYVDRGDILNQVEEQLNIPAARVALVGIGGVGKSQLAIEYSYRARDISLGTWVFWVHAANTARFQESYKILADRVKLPGREDALEILQPVCNWLSDPANGKWLMILDNSDDHKVFFDQIQQLDDAITPSPETSAGLAKFVPQVAHGSILVTSRDRAAAFRLTGRHKNIIDVNPMDPATSLSLLQRKLGSRFDDQFGAKVVDKLDCIPLAITQAAAYICQRTPSCSVQQHIDHLRDCNRNQATLLNHDAGDLRRDASASSSVMLTWQISFEQIKRERRSAADLLSLMSLCDRQGIPQSLLKELYKPVETPSLREEIVIQKKTSRFRFWRRKTKVTVSSNNQGENKSALLRGAKTADQDAASKGFVASAKDGTESRNAYDLDDDLDVLGRYLLIVETADRGSFGMHRLVQLATRQWLKWREEIERWREKYVELLLGIFPSGNFETWDACRILYPHALTMFDHPPTSGKWLGRWALVFEKVGFYALGIGDFSGAERILNKVVRVEGEVFGQNSIHRLSSMRLLGTVQRCLGKLAAAEKVTRISFSGCQKVFGEEDIATLRAENDLSLIEHRQGKVEEAYERQRRIVEVLERTLGEDHIDTIAANCILSDTLLNQNKYAEAERIAEKVLSGMKKNGGEDHPHALYTKHTLAQIRGNQGKHEEAEQLFREVVEKRDIAFGKAHHDTLCILGGLALSLSKQGRREEALNAHLRAYEGFKRVLGPEHPNTLISAENCAAVRLMMERQAEAPKGQHEESLPELERSSSLRQG